MPTLSIIGAGKVSQVLGRLWNEADHFHIQQVLNRNLASGRAATDFMGGGDAVSGWQRLKPADFWLIGTPDDAIWSAACELSQTSAIRPGQVVFHLSGARDRSALAMLDEQGLKTASLHPLKSIPEASRGYQGFAETWCALEGDDSACQDLHASLEVIGAQPFRIRSDQKILYHAGNTMLSNYLITLLDMGLKIYEIAGIPPEQARAMVAPLMSGTLKNGLEMGPDSALTGPIVRGDLDIIRAHMNALPRFAREGYRELGLHTVEMALESGQIDAEHQRQLLELLEQNSI
jgi:predicted short-subunit dehydrogenase-like oxidoreductase (DUF2520 family)